jgi:capsular polysaccharide biosynthesis protein
MKHEYPYLRATCPLPRRCLTSWWPWARTSEQHRQVHAPAEDEEFVSVADTARSARRRLWIVILLPLLTAGTAVGVSLLQPPVYEASATVVVSPREGESQQGNISNTISGLQILAHEMAVVGLNRSMVEEIVNTQGEPSAVSEADLNNNLAIAQDEGTRFLSLTYRDADKKQGASSGQQRRRDLRKKGSRSKRGGGRCSGEGECLCGSAHRPRGSRPTAQRPRALAMGLMLGIGLAFLLEYLHLSGLHSPEKVEQVSGVPTFGTIPDFEAARARRRRSGHVA